MAEKVASLITDDMRAWAVRLSREGGEYDRMARLAAAEERGEKRGIHTAKLETASNLIKMGMSHNQISEATGLSLSEIRNLK